MRTFRWWPGWVLLIPLVGGSAPGREDAEAPGARAKPRPRKLLYPARAEDVPEPLRPVVGRLLSPDQPPADSAQVRPAGVFARVISRADALDGAGLKKEATLGTRPFVFVTLPEALHGRSLLDVFSVIGYPPDGVLTGEKDREKVAVVFRWEDQVALHRGRNGRLPDNWGAAVYPTTWDNLFALVEAMAADEGWHYVARADRPRAVTRLELRFARERQFILGFPQAGKLRLKCSSYHLLREQKGADWEYRQLLERTMGAAEHFTGDGTSKQTLVRRGETPARFAEFVGPNRRLSDLPEIAVIGLGTLRVGE